MGATFELSPAEVIHEPDLLPTLGKRGDALRVLLKNTREGLQALAQSIQGQLGIPWLMEALVKTASIELRGLPWADRRIAVVGSMKVGDLELAKNRCVLIVDDVTTSGATFPKQRDYCAQPECPTSTPLPFVIQKVEAHAESRFADSETSVT